MMGMQEQVSPLKRNRKRNRMSQVEDEIVQEMDLDQVSSLSSISDLSIEELLISQTIAKEQLKQHLFITIEVDTRRVVKNPFDVSEDFRMEGENIQDSALSPFFAPLLFTVCELVLKQRNATPFQISSNVKMTTRSTEIKDKLLKNSTIQLQLSDTSQLARIIMYIIDQTPQLFADNLGPVCQGILAINQIMGINRRIDGANIKVPNSTVKQLVRFHSFIRNVLILTPTLSRQLLQFIVKFSCTLCQQIDVKSRNGWARQLSLSFCPLISKNGWAIHFFELLLHSHGLHLESQVQETREIWSIDDKFRKDIKQRLDILRTPRKKSNMTPRKSTRLTRCLTGTGTSLKRNLFRDSTIESVASYSLLIRTNLCYKLPSIKGISNRKPVN